MLPSALFPLSWGYTSRCFYTVDSFLNPFVLSLFWLSEVEFFKLGSLYPMTLNRRSKGGVV